MQPSYETSTGLWGRSYQESVYVRPTDSVDIVGNYFIPGWLGGDHALKFGFKDRNDIAHSENQMGGNAYARFTNGAPNAAQIYRNGLTEYGLHNRSFYAQDTFSKDKLTVNLGFRYDYQTDFANAEDVPASPFYGQATFSGTYVAPVSSYARYNGTYTGAAFDQLPGVSFPGAKALGDKNLAFKNWSPRIGLTYDLTGDGKNVAKFNYSRYVGQIGTGTLSSTYTSTGSRYVRYPWVDVNGDGFIQANEIVLISTPLAYSSGYDYNNPSDISTTGTNDPNITDDRTDEILVGFDRQIGTEIAVGVSYIWRKYQNFRWSDTPNWDSSNYEPVTYQPTSCPAGARCESVTYYQRTSQIPVAYIYTNQPDYWRGYQGFEMSVRKRMSHNWMMNGGFSYNNAPVHYDSPAAYEDPTNIDQQNGGQYAPESTSSGLGNVFVNARWIFRLSGAYTLPWYRDRRGRVLQLAPGLSVHRHGPDADPAVQRRSGGRGPRQAGRQPSAELPDGGLPPRQAHHAVRAREDHGQHGRVQPVQREHGPVGPRAAERQQREPDQLDSRAARAAVRVPRDLVDVDHSGRRTKGGPPGPPFVCTGARDRGARSLVAHTNRACEYRLT